VLSPKGKIGIVEVKSSIADFRADNKWHEYQEFCDFFWFATLPDVPADIFPDEIGFMIADQFGADIQREAEELSVSAAMRKSMHLRFARASALRLKRCVDHFGDANIQLVDADDAV